MAKWLRALCRFFWNPSEAHYARRRRQTITDEKTQQYLDELIGQKEKIRPLIQASNEMLNIILGGRLSAAHDQGIKIEITRASAPEQLPLSDADLCSLMMNVMDNAVTATGASDAMQPCIRLDLHMKNNFFVFVCEKSTAPSSLADPDDPIKKTCRSTVWV